MRSNYWTCSKFADWLRGTMKPSAATAGGWSTWKKEARTQHPIRFWLAEEGLDKIQTAVMWPVDRMYDVKYYINNRWITKTHTLTASSLKAGKWHEFETRVLHCLFDELVNYVEVESAWSHIMWADEQERKKYDTPFWASGWFRWRTWRSPQAGKDHLKWAANLKFDDNWGVSPESESYGKPTHQAIAAQEILALYEWWSIYRPLRPDPYDVSGWSAICSRRRDRDPDDIFGEDKTPTDREETTKSLDAIQKMEEDYEREDEEMLIRLIKIRGSMWT